MDEYRESTAEVVRRNIVGMLRLAGQGQKDLAKSMRLNQGNVSRKIGASAQITLDDLDLVARHFGVTVSDLVRPGCLPAQHMIAGEV
jgi:BMFP domain-containing protein YqiC